VTQVVADTGYRSESVIANLAIDHSDTELVTALGRVDKVLATPRDAQRYPHTVAMAAKFETEQGKRDYGKRKWIAEPPNGWIKSVLGFRQLSMRGLQKTKAEFKLFCMAKSGRVCLPTLQSHRPCRPQRGQSHCRAWCAITH
jgi:hypothetical protein